MLSLPEDILIAILTCLPLPDILNLRQTCRALHALGCSRAVWTSILQTEVLDKSIPIPGISKSAPDTLTIEQRVRRALRLHQRWTSSNPQSTAEYTFHAGDSARVVDLRFLPRDNGRWLVALAYPSQQAPSRSDRVFTLQCWDLMASPPRCIAYQAIKEFGGLTLNSDPESQFILSIKTSSVNLLGIDFEATNPENGFLPSLSIDQSLQGVYHLSGSTILTRAQDKVLLFDIHNPNAPIELASELSPSGTAQFEPVLDAIIDGSLGLVVLIKSTKLELYALSEAHQNNILVPLYTHIFQWRIDSVVMSQQAFTPGSSPSSPPPINILVRFGSLFPWPVNALHHFTLEPNEFYDPTLGTELTNYPYQLTPTLRQTIGSPVRLFATSHMVIGTYGTAIWFDSHTEDYFGHADRGQRLAGRSLRTEPVEDEGVVLSSAATCVYGVREVDAWVRLAMCEEEGIIAVGAADGEISIRKYA
ncbi:hypothetical protein BDN72DRAFT_895502 [Pluteus cervinus]|uniref:Uncharacterized protein n=1 Tax=Pluteus cervinus TaxID=181527 RepID=A0ACD3B240_9AGAR|nr:hypothetical protein BDN72DRAFT_895502 [Pluteus cervinus]